MITRRFKFDLIYQDWFLPQMEELQGYQYQDRKSVKIAFDQFFLEWLLGAVKEE